MIKCIQINLNHCRVAQDLLMQTDKDRHINISIISEPYRIPDVTWVANKSGTAAIHCNVLGLPYTGILKNQSRFTVTIQWQEITNVSCYISPNFDAATFEEFLDKRRLRGGSRYRRYYWRRLQFEVQSVGL